MNFVAALFAPLILLFPAGEPDGSAMSSGKQEGPAWQVLMENAQSQTADQVRLEQRVTIRVAPRQAQLPHNLLADLPDGETGPHFRERKFGHCLPVSSIAGVQSGGGSRLILFLRDQRIVSASLERACRARDFYSGFYLARSEDGQMCIERDTLLSRNGAACRVTRMRQLIPLRGDPARD